MLPRAHSTLALRRAEHFTERNGLLVMVSVACLDCPPWDLQHSIGWCLLVLAVRADFPGRECAEPEQQSAEGRDLRPAPGGADRHGLPHRM